jgi:hypothetical protein
MEHYKHENGDWGLGIGDWGLGPIPNPQSPIPNYLGTVCCGILFDIISQFYIYIHKDMVKSAQIDTNIKVF